MTLEQLKSAQEEVSTKYNVLEKQKGEIEVEQIRLQGEHRALQKLIDVETPTPTGPKESKNKLGKPLNA
jgi:hypothetical protein